MLYPWLLAGTAACLISLCVAAAAAAEDANVYLDENSVVLITGAAGFLGSELAMALYRTYQPKKLICVDSMDAGFGVSDANKSEPDLALFEFKRQRVFHMLQTVDAASIFFYRVDLRPSIPEYFDTSEVPVLHHIFEEHADITHVVHLADHNVHHHPAQNAANHESPFQPVIPRVKGQEKAGMMESMLEELLLQRETNKGNNNKKHIQFVYASSSLVYNHYAANHHHSDNDNNNNDGADISPNPPPFSEAKPLTTPSTAAGASKLVDELIAQAYHEVHGLASTGLRFFHVYGPWGLPGSALFEMAGRAVAGQDPAAAILSAGGGGGGGDDGLDDVADYIYIDDAIDALMSAMQFKTAQPSQAAIAINVGTGTGTSLRSIAEMMRQLISASFTTTTNTEHIIRPVVDNSAQRPARTVSYADTTRASTLLGFAPQVSLQQGIEKLLAWHYDRAFPYGSGSSSSSSSDGQAERPRSISAAASCGRYDTECLKGTPVFPCASECSRSAHQCKRSLYDDVLDLTRAVTATQCCTTVLYTVSLGNDVTHIPSTRVRVSTQSIASVDEVDSAAAAGCHCNLAFVSETSPLYATLARDKTSQAAASSTDGVVMHGFWALIPVAVTEYAQDNIKLLSLLPKLSPGKFFADTVEKAIYCDPDVIFDNIPRLIQESNMQPKHPSIQGSTVMMIGKKPIDVTEQQRPLHATTEPTPPNELVQNTAYRMIRMAVIDEMAGDGFAQKIDAGFVVHTLRGPDDDDDGDDGRLFRCDVFGEVLQWKVDSDVAAFEFILGLHDMWSRVMVKKSGLEPWWIGDEVASVISSTMSRRLQEVSDEEENEDTSLDSANRKLTEEESPDEDDEGALDVENDKEDPNFPDPGEHNGFGVVGAIEGDKQKQQQRFDRPEDEEAFDFVVDDDDPAESNPIGGSEGSATDDAPRYYLPNADQDPSSYDVWMGVLSSTTHVRYFGRIVAMDAVGVYRVSEDLDKAASASE